MIGVCLMDSISTSLNVSALVFSTSYQIDSTTLPQLLQHHDLGLLLSHNLSWSNHYQWISAKAYKYFGLLRRVFKNIQSISAKKLLYTSLVRSQLT